MKDRTPSKPIVIVGAGPCGCALALELIQKGYAVILINEDPYSTRMQRVSIKDLDARKILHSYIDKKNDDDLEFEKKLITNNYIIRIDALEYFLKNKIETLTAARFPDRFTYIDRTIGELTSIDTEDHKIELAMKNKSNPNNYESTQAIPFMHLIDATGNKRAALTLANPQESVSESLGTLRHQAQGTASFKLPKDLIQKKYPHLKDKKGVVYKLMFSANDVQQLKLKYGWNHDNEPSIYIFANAKHTRFYVGGEIPGSITKIRIFDDAGNRDTTQEQTVKRQKVEAWFKHMMNFQFGVAPHDLQTYSDENPSSPEFLKSQEKFRDKYGLSESMAKEAAAKQYRMSITNFDLLLTRAKNPVQDLSGDKKHLLVTLGDATQSSHFHLSHGISDALNSVKAFMECIPDIKSDAEFDTEKLLTFINSLQKKHKKTINDMIGNFFIPSEKKYNIDESVLKYAQDKIETITNKSTHEINEEDLHTLMDFNFQISQRKQHEMPEEKELNDLALRCNKALEYVQNVIDQKASPEPPKRNKKEI